MDPFTIFTSAAGLALKTASFLNDATVTDEGFIRAYYLEVSKNIEILKTIDFSCLKETDITSESFKSVINSLDTTVGSALLCSDCKKRKRILSFLGQGLVIQSPQDKSFTLESDDEVTVLELRIDVLKAVWFTVHKIELLKSLASLNGDMFKQKFKLDVRIANINIRLQNIRQKLAENEAMISLK